MRRRKGERGIALILALLVLVLLVVLITQMSITSLHNRTISENHMGDLQNTYGTRSGYHLALLFLQADQERGGAVDTLLEKWASPLDVPLGRASVRVTTHDSERFLNLSQLVNDKGEPAPAAVAQLRRLVRLLRHPPETADRILDYIDSDTRGNFENRARNERLHGIDELLKVEGLAPEVLYGGKRDGEERKGIMEFLTVWPRPQAAAEGQPPSSSLVNVNTTSAEILESLSDKMTVQLAEGIVEFRNRAGANGLPQPYNKPEDVKQAPGMSDEVYASIADRLTVKAETFEIKVRSSVGNVEKSWVYVVRRSSGQKAALTLVASQRMNDFLSVRPPETEEK